MWTDMYLRIFHRTEPSPELMLAAKIIIMLKLGIENIFKENPDVISQLWT